MTILQDQETPSVDVPTWKFVLGTIRFRWWYYLFNNLAFNLMTLAWLVPGLITRAVFNLLSGNAPARSMRPLRTCCDALPLTGRSRTAPSTAAPLANLYHRDPRVANRGGLRLTPPRSFHRRDPARTVGAW